MHRNILIAIAASTLLIVLGVAVLWTINRLVIEPCCGFDRELAKSFASVRPGMTKKEVLRRLGDPVDEDTRFRLSQERGFEAEYERAEESGSAYFLFWRNDIDITYAIGFDEDDRVTMKSAGGT